MISILVQYLDSLIGPVAYEYSALRVHRQGMNPLKLSRPRTFLSPGGDELTVFRELDDAVVMVISQLQIPLFNNMWNTSQVMFLNILGNKLS